MLCLAIFHVRHVQQIRQQNVWLAIFLTPTFLIKIRFAIYAITQTVEFVIKMILLNAMIAELAIL